MEAVSSESQDTLTQSQDTQFQSQETEQTSDDGSPSRSAARGLRNRKQVVYNEAVMAKRASTDSDDDEDVGKENEDDFDEEVDDEARRRPLELWADGEATSSATEGESTSGVGVAGHELFGFKKVKRKDALTKTVTYSTNAALKEREAAEEVLKTPKKGGKDERKTELPRTPSAGKRGQKPNKSHLLKTPHRLRRRMDQGIDIEEESDPSFSEGSDDEEEDDDSDEDFDDDVKNNNNNNNEKSANDNNIKASVPSLFDTVATPTAKPKKQTAKETAEKSGGRFVPPPFRFNGRGGKGLLEERKIQEKLAFKDGKLERRS